MLRPFSSTFSVGPAFAAFVKVSAKNMANNPLKGTIVTGVSELWPRDIYRNKPGRCVDFSVEYFLC